MAPVKAQKNMTSQIHTEIKTCFSILPFTHIIEIDVAGFRRQAAYVQIGFAELITLAAR